MPYNISGRIPPAVWWLVGISVLIISLALALVMLGSDNVKVGADGIEVRSESTLPVDEAVPDPSPDVPSQEQFEKGPRKGHQTGQEQQQIQKGF